MTRSEETESRRKEETGLVEVVVDIKKRDKREKKEGGGRDMCVRQ